MFATPSSVLKMNDCFWNCLIILLKNDEEDLGTALFCHSGIIKRQSPEQMFDYYCSKVTRKTVEMQLCHSGRLTF